MIDNEINHLRGSDPGGATGGVSVDVYAHRGSMLLAPENTALAFERALGFGADVLEIDVRLSADGHVIVTHDAAVDRTCDGTGLVRQMSLSQLKSLHAGWRFNDLEGRSYRDQPISLITLDEMFEQFPTARINIDIKDNDREAAYAIARSVTDADAQKRVNVGSFHAQALAHFRRALPGVTTAATQSEVASLYFGRSLIQTVNYHYLQIPCAYYGLPLTTESFLQSARRLNVQCVYWTINEVQSMQTLVHKGVDGIVTDRVDLACELLGKNPSA